MSRKLNLNTEPEYPKLITSEIGTVLSLDVSAHFRAEGGCVVRYGTPNCEDKWVESQNDLQEVTRLIQEMDQEDLFDSPFNSCIARCLEYSYLVELAAQLPVFFTDKGIAMSEEFLEEAFGYRVDCDLQDALKAVKPLEEWPVWRKRGDTKACFLISIQGHNAGLLSFTTRGVLFQYRIQGTPYAYYLGFKDYSELDTQCVGKYDWYAACWKHLFWQLLAAVGIVFDDLHFFYQEGCTEHDDYRWDGQGIQPFRVTNPEDLLEHLNDTLYIWRHERVIY